MIARGTLDISPTDLTITNSRSTVVDFLPAITESYQQLFIRNPAEALNWKAYIDPLSPLCWVVVILFVVVVPPIIAGIMLYGNVYIEVTYTKGIPLEYLKY